MGNTRKALAVVSAVVALIGPGFAFAPSATAAPLTQDGPINYAGPGPCPLGATDCAIVTGSLDVEQTGLSNTAVCDDTTTAAASEQSCKVKQTGNTNTIDARLVARPATGGVGGINLATVLQQNEQRFVTTQNGETNKLKITAEITQTAQSVFDAATPVTHTQRTLQYANNRLDATKHNEIEYALTRTQTSTATGATPTQRQDDTPGSEADGGKLGLGHIDLVANSAGTSKVKIRGTDTKDATATSLNLGTATQQLGHDDGGWTTSLDIDTAVGGTGADLDVGDPNGTPGLVKDWSAHATGPLGVGVGRDQDLIDDIKIPLIGKSPVNATAHGQNTLSSDPGAHVVCSASSDGHVQNLMNGRLGCDVTAGARRETPSVSWSAQDWDVSLLCEVNTDNCPGGTVHGPKTVAIKVFGEDKKAGSIPVAILTSPDFDALSVDPATVCFGDAEAPIERDCTQSNRGTGPNDVDADGDLDLKMHFDSAETGIDKSDSTACLTGKTYEGDLIAGCGPLPKG